MKKILIFSWLAFAGGTVFIFIWDFPSIRQFVLAVLFLASGTVLNHLLRHPKGWVGAINREESSATVPWMLFSLMVFFTALLGKYDFPVWGHIQIWMGTSFLYFFFLYLHENGVKEEILKGIKGNQFEVIVPSGIGCETCQNRHDCELYLEVFAKQGDYQEAFLN
jgi:hypothetical protein